MQIEKETQDINILFSVARLANFDGKGVELIFSVLNNTILPNNIPMNEMSFEIACDACADVGACKGLIAAVVIAPVPSGGRASD